MFGSLPRHEPIIGPESLASSKVGLATLVQTKDAEHALFEQTGDVDIRGVGPVGQDHVAGLEVIIQSADERQFMRAKGIDDQVEQGAVLQQKTATI